MCQHWIEVYSETSTSSRLSAVYTSSNNPHTRYSQVVNGVNNVCVKKLPTLTYHYLYLCIIPENTVYININIQVVQKAAIIIMLLTSYLKIGLYLQHP